LLKKYLLEAVRMKYIIVGATGYLGHSIFSALVKTNHDLVYGTGHNNCIPGIISLDLAAKSDMQKIVSLKPDVVIWCACDYEKENPAYPCGISGMY
jgi:dTDP-4-dehydrorhamnose reductase